MNLFLIVTGLAIAGLALRTFSPAMVRRLGSLVILAATFLAGYAVFGTVWAGAAGVLLWFAVPMFQVALAARKIALPLEKKFRQRIAPSDDEFPELDELTGEFETAGFTVVEDIGWDWQDMRQFARLMIQEERRLQGSIHLNTQGDLSVSYGMLVTRSTDGSQWTSWNYPCGMGMKLPPECTLNRVSGADSLEELIEAHDQFLLLHGVTEAKMVPPDPDQLLHLTHTETRRQIDHNLDEGLLRLCGEGKFAYSWRGCLFMMRQLMVDMLRLS